jgi:hypothetical protein
MDLNRAYLGAIRGKGGFTAVEAAEAFQIDTLKEHRSLIALREERNQADAIGVARSTTTAEGDKRQRYIGMNTRLSQAAYRLLFQMQHERRKYGEGDMEGLEPMQRVAAAAAPQAATEAQPGGPRRWRKPPRVGRAGGKKRMSKRSPGDASRCRGRW